MAFALTAPSASAGTPAQFGVAGLPSTLGVGECSNAITVQLLDAAGEPVTANITAGWLNATYGTRFFPIYYSDPQCMDAVTTANFATSSTVVVYVLGPSAGTSTFGIATANPNITNFNQTVSIVPPVNGTCGSANGAVTATQPAAGNLCSSGTGSTVGLPASTTNWAWTWSCEGAYGGTTKPCSAPGGFNILGITGTANFSPGQATMGSKIPQISYTNSNGQTVPLDSVGYQDGFYIASASKVLYVPWKVETSTGQDWLGHATSDINQSVIVSYSPNYPEGGNPLQNFGNANYWNAFDLMNLVPQGSPGVAASYTGGTTLGTQVYLAPSGVNFNPVFVVYSSQYSVTDQSAYNTFIPPALPSPLPSASPSPSPSPAFGSTYGWCEAITDAQGYIYYVPNNNGSISSGNVFRYNSQNGLPGIQGFSNSANWKSFDMTTVPYANTAYGYQSAVYDGHRYIYYIPFETTVMMRFDTWDNGGSPSPNTAFTDPNAYKPFEPNRFGQTGEPQVSGNGSVANLVGFTGGVVAWGSAVQGVQTEYLYLVPWASVAQGSLNPTLQSTAARVPIGTMSGGVWNWVDVTSTNTVWEIFDLSSLTSNAAWPSNWTSQWPSSPSGFPAGSSMSGWQNGYVVTAPSGVSPRVGFGPDLAQYFVQHNVQQALNDPTAWYVAPIPTGYNMGTMGGGYDSANNIVYASSPAVPLFAIQFMAP